MRVCRYAVLGLRRSEVVELRRDVHCLSASLSVQDLLRVAGASGLAVLM